MKKTKHVIKFGSALALSACLAGAANSQEGESKHAVGVNLNPFGLGAFYTYKLNQDWQLRTTLNGSSLEEIDVEFSDVDYEGDSDSFAAGVILDWYPMSEGWKRNVFFSAGVYYTDSEFDGEAESKLNETILIGGAPVSPGDIDGLSLMIENQETTPYLGLGWGNKVDNERGFSFIGEIGVVYLDDQDVSLIAVDPNGVISAEDLQRETDDIQDELDGLNGFVSVGVSYHF